MEQFSLFEKQESLDVLNYQIRACESCSLSVTRKDALPGEGNIDARIMFVALSPEAKENSENRMFVGPSGQVFNKLLHAARIDRELVLIAGCSHPKMENILKATLQFGKVYSIIGGLHGFNEFELFKDLGIICPIHCTQHIPEIKSLYPEKYIEGEAGKIIEI